MKERQPLPGAILSLRSVDVLIRSRLKKVNASPFIAHLELSEDDRIKVVNGIKLFVQGQPGRIAYAIENFPAAATWLLSVTLAHKYRSEEVPTNAIYPHIAEAFDTSPIDNNADRKQLSTAFRRAANRFGLVLPPRTADFVDAYICQAGIARVQLPALVQAFMCAEWTFGPPPDEDTQRLNMWEVRSAQTFALGMSRLQKIMVWDQTAYHAACFARARHGDLAFPLARVMAEAIQTIQSDVGPARLAGRELPRIALIDAVPVVIAPSHTAIEVTERNRTRRVAAGRSCELTAPWTSRINVKLENEEGGQSNIDLLYLTNAESIAIFDADSGVLLNSFNPGNGSNTVSIDAHEVAITCRTKFVAGNERSQQIGSEAHIAFVILEDSIEVIIGHSRFTITPPSRPRLWISASRVATGPGGGLLAHPHLLDVSIPQGGPEKDVILHIEHPALKDPIRLPLSGATGTFNLSSLLPRQGPAGPLRLSLTLGENGRTLVRASHWVWPGLEKLDGFDFLGPTPSNLSISNCEHVFCNNSGIVLEAGQEWRKAQLAFSHQNRIVRFELPRPGRTVILLDDAGRERAHVIGERITVLPGSREQLVIRTDDPDARLIIRGVIEEDSFGLSRVRRISLATLADSGSDNRIIYLPGGDANRGEIIAELILSTEPTYFALENDRRTGNLIVTANFNVRIDAIRLSLNNLSNSTFKEWETPLANRQVNGDTTLDCWGSLEPLSDNPDGVRINLALKTSGLVDECSTAELAIRVEGEDDFRALRNIRGDEYVFLIGPSASCKTTRAYLGACSLLGRCIAPETWPYVKPMIAAWRETGEELVARGDRETLIRGWGVPLPPGQSTSWVPLHHPIEIDHELLSASMIDFHAIGENGEGTAELAQLYRLAAFRRVREAAEVLEVDPTFFCGFSNFQDVHDDPRLRLRDFSFARLLQMRGMMVLSEGAPSSWQPSCGRLTKWHHEWCVDQFIERFQLAMPDDTSNHERMMRLNKMVNALPRERRTNSFLVSSTLSDRCHLSTNLASFISVAVHAWRNDTFGDLLQELCNVTDVSRGQFLQDMGLLLRLAPELTAFYMLLWELVCMSENKKK